MLSQCRFVEDGTEVVEPVPRSEVARFKKGNERKCNLRIFESFATPDDSLFAICDGQTFDSEVGLKHHAARFNVQRSEG